MFVHAYYSIRDSSSVHQACTASAFSPSLVLVVCLGLSICIEFSELMFICAEE